MLPASVTPVGYSKINTKKKLIQSNSSVQPIMAFQNLRPMEGKLSKYTNVMKGWQNRYFIVNVSSGYLEYHVSQSERNSRPRGSINLAGSVVAPSSDDSYTFAVNPTNGEVYKLRAGDAKQRQEWVSHLRTVANHFTQQIAQDHPPIMSYAAPQSEERKRTRSMVSNISNKIKDAADQVQQKTVIQIGHLAAKHLPNEHKAITGSASVRYTDSNQPHVATVPSPAPLPSHHKELRSVKEALYAADNYHASLMSVLDKLPNGHVGDTEKVPVLSATDREVLLLKATSAATLQCLAGCYNILSRHQQHYQPTSEIGATIPRGGNESVTDDGSSIHSQDGDGKQFQQFDPAELQNIDQHINPDDEQQDTVVVRENDLGTVETHKSVIMHLLSQLKLGMDLTRVTLPTFILEKRSLLEMYADFIAMPDLFLKIPDGPTPRQRMMNVVKFYLLSFHCGREGSMAKKPYNPILGETFHCSYYVPKKAELPQDNDGTLPQSGSCDRLRFTAEQVSHHPPVSAFYAECNDRNITMTGHIWTRSKFMNMSIGVNNIGEAVINLLEHNEKYTITFPSAFARSILTIPWVELGGRCSINCEETNNSANVVFHTKPMYGGNPHKVSATIRDESETYCTVEGEWNGVLNFSRNMSDSTQKLPCQTEAIDVTQYTSQKKYVRPIDKQSPMESRALWRHVTSALHAADISEATNHKNTLENDQRSKESLRVNACVPVSNKLFRKINDNYVYVSTQ